MDGSQTAEASASTPKPPAGSGDDRADLLSYHIAKIKPLQAFHAEEKAKATAAAESVTAALNTACADLDVEKPWLLRRIDMSNRSQRDLLEQLALDRWANNAQGFVDQIDAFGGEETPQSAKDGNFYRLQGFADGLNGNASRPPEAAHQLMIQEYQTGWGEGQAALMSRNAAARARLDAQGQPSTAPAVNLNDPDEEEADDEETIKARADKLKASGFMDGAKGAGSKPGDIKPEGQAAKVAAKTGAGVH
jgi:hypothetical protein